MYSAFRYLGVAGLVAGSTADAQSPSALLNHTSVPYGISQELTYSSTRREAGSSITLVGERALLGRIEHHASSTEPAESHHVPIDGARALQGRWPTGSEPRPDRATLSSFLAEIRGDVVASTSGDAEFGFVPGTEGSASRFTVSLGARGTGSAVLFTGPSGAPLAAGRYRVGNTGNGMGEVLALVVTGTPTNPTGVFRGRSGWLEVTAISDGLLLGRFQLDGVGFLAADPQQEDRPVQVSGSFSATSL